jgi:hypothetical protein
LRSPTLLFRDHAVLIRVSPGYPPLKGKFLRIPHPSATRVLLPPFDLHVLGMPPAFNLSQDQTLQLNLKLKFKLDWQLNVPGKNVFAARRVINTCSITT